MLFTKIGKFIAWFLFVTSSLHVALAFSIAFFTTTQESWIAYSRRYLGSKTTGQSIDQGLKLVFLAIALGILVEISNNIKASKNKPSEHQPD